MKVRADLSSELFCLILSECSLRDPGLPGFLFGGGGGMNSLSSADLKVSADLSSELCILSEFSQRDPGLPGTLFGLGGGM